MNFDLAEITNNALVVVPVVIAIVQAIKLTNWVQDHFAPIASILVGIGVAFLVDFNAANISLTVFSGTIYGLMASGLYSGVKTTMIAHQRMKRQEEKKQSTTQNNNDKC